MSKLWLKFGKVKFKKSQLKKAVLEEIRNAWKEAIEAAVIEAVWRVGMDTGMSRASWYATAEAVDAEKTVIAATKHHGSERDGKSYIKGINIGEPAQVELGERNNRFYFKFNIRPIQYRVNENTLKQWKTMQAASRAFMEIMNKKRKQSNIDIRYFFSFRRK